MTGKFVLEIELGNSAMRTRGHVASALSEVEADVVAGKSEGRIRDVNGNTVGKWELKKE